MAHASLGESMRAATFLERGIRTTCVVAASAAASLAIAVACAQPELTRIHWPINEAIDLTTWRLNAPAGFASSPQTAAPAFVGFGARSVAMQARHDGALEQISVHCYGWPLYCLHYAVIGDGTMVRRTMGLKYLKLPDGSALNVPLRPLWPGVVGNMAIYSGAIWLACLLRHCFRRLLRRRRGCCVACGYRLAGGMCPECGQRRIA